MKKITLLFAILLSLTAFSQTQIDLPIDWEGTTTNYTVQDFGSNSSSVVADPLNSMNTVLQSIKTSTAATWAGTSLCDVAGLASAIPFTATANTITVFVYSPDAGIPVRLKAEDNSDPTKSVETEVMTTVANAWDTLVFDFSNEATGTAAINYTYTYNKLSIFYNFGTDGATAGAKTYYCDEVFFGGTAVPPAVHNVTFRVNMNSYAGTFTTPEVNGMFNGWCGNCNAMTDSDGDGIWEITLPITDDSTEYKFAYDNWTGQENLTPGTSCTKTTGPNTNRFIVLTGDTVLPAVCWDSCSTCAGGPSNVTFQVDMNDYTGSFTTPEVNGLFNSWCGNCAAMSDANSDGIWEITIPIADDSTEYKFSFDNWAGQETLLPGSSCTKTLGANTNRFIVLTGDTVLPPVCWESCDVCTGIPTSAKVTFKVDLSNYTGSYSTVNLNGTFNNWCGGCAVMTSPNNDNIYEIEVVVPTDTIDYKFTLDGWTAEESLTEGLPCTKTVTDASGTFTNRFLVPSGDTILPAVCWEACDACAAVGITENNWISDFKVTPNPNNGVFNISGNLNSNELIKITITDIQGRVIYEDTELNNTFSKSINISFAEHGMYILKMSSETNVLTEKIIYTK